MRRLSEWRRQLITAKSMASARAESCQKHGSFFHKSEKDLAAHILDGWKAVVDRNNLHKWLFGRLMARYSVQFVLLLFICNCVYVCVYVFVCVYHKRCRLALLTIARAHQNARTE